jgi:type IV pilus assembly protein PilO
MAKINLTLVNLPKGLRIAIAVLPPVLWIFAFGFFGIMPKINEINTLRKEISSQENDMAKSQSMAMKLDVLRIENEKIKRRLEQLGEQLPEEKEVSELLRQVSDKGQDAGLDIQTWKPAQRRLHASNIVYEVPVAVTLIGSYHRLGYFFSSLTKLNRIVNISDIKLGNPKPKGEEAELNVTFTAITFTAATEGGLSQPTAAAPAEKADAKKQPAKGGPTKPKAAPPKGGPAK